MKTAKKATITSFRRGKRTYTPRHFAMSVDGVKTRKEAEKFIGKSVEWKSSAGKIIKGKIASAHGNNGLMRAIFEKGLPGQAVNSEVEISE
ncbi:MAG: 50S ribosomal protein L35ae [Candidatus Paceibacterota bacterium]